MSFHQTLAFMPGQGTALAAVVGFAALSLIAIDFVWIRVLWVAVNQLLGRGSLQAIKRERAIFHSQLGAYMASLLLSNLLSSISFIMNVTWISEGGITAGGLCSSQAGLSQVADVATAYFTGAIAVHSFNSLVLRYRLPMWFCGLMVIFGWAASIVIAIFPIHTETKSGPFYSIDGIFCGISPEYPLFETLIHLVPIFVASLVAAVFYSLVFLILRGTIAIRGGIKFNLDPESRRNTVHDAFEYPKFIASIARTMLWYPVAYIVLMFPHLVTCLLAASGFRVSNIWRVVTACASAMLGLANVLIFYNTIRIMGPAFDGPTRTANTSRSESFVNKNDSPVDVAPPIMVPVAQPPKAFPPPRSVSHTPRPSVDSRLTHSRDASTTSLGGDSTRRLLAPHARTDSSLGHMVQTGEIARAITPISRLNEMIAAPAPAAMKDKSLPRLTLDAHSLPAPPREGRSPVVRHPTITAGPVDNAMLSAVPLQTPPFSGDSSYTSKRDSFINMYASRTPLPPMPSAIPAETRRPIPPALPMDEATRIGMPSFGGSPDYSSSSASASGSGSDVPRSAFEETMPILKRAPTSRSFRSEVRQRVSMIESPESGGLSSIAWATLVADAAMSNGGVRTMGEVTPQVKAMRRRSKSMESLSVPSNLRPGALMSSGSPRDVARARTVMPKSAGIGSLQGNRVARWDSKAVYHQGPSRTPAYNNAPSPARQSQFDD